MKRVYRFGHFDRKEGFRTESFGEIKGLVHKAAGEQSKPNPAEHLSEEKYRQIAFDSDPAEVIPYEDYWQHNAGIFDEDNMRLRGATLKTIRLFTSSHCPNGCGFCSSSGFLGKAMGRGVPVYRLSAPDVFELVRKNVTIHSPDAIFFNDDDFVIGDADGRERAKEFARLIIEAKDQGVIPERLKFYMQTKAKSLVVNDEREGRVPDMEMLRLLKEAGFVTVAVGVESFSDKILSSPSINKKTNTDLMDKSQD